MKRWTSIGLGLFGILLAQNVLIATGNAAGYSWDPGTQLNQTRSYLEEQRIRARLEQEQKQAAAAVEDARPSSENVKSENIKFTLQKVNFDESQVLSRAELQKLAAKYLNKEITLQDLYTLTKEINELYSSKGYIVCRATLPPQTIKDGQVYIRLIEGRTGKVTVENNKSTNTSYITNRINLKPGKVERLTSLNDKLVWLNGTNDVQLRIKLKAGEKPGTTDYELMAYEPRRESAYVLVDTAGSENTGIWRFGTGWMTKSLFGNRDTLLINGMASLGTRSGGISYSTPITTSGTRLGAQYSANTVKVMRGDYSDLDIRGHASMYNFSLTQPLVISRRTKVEAEVDYDHQHSATDILGNSWVDDTIKKWTAGLAFTHYGKNSIWYHRHSYSWGNWEDAAENNSNFGKYNLYLLSQYVLSGHKILTGKLNAQWSGTSYLPSAEQFYIGGINSVRGYKENILSGDKGFSTSLELAVPDRKNSEWVYFFDYGNVGGDSAFDDHVLMSTGLGYRLRLGNSANASLFAGVPFRRTINEVDQSKIRLHFMFYGQF